MYYLLLEEYAICLTMLWSNRKRKKKIYFQTELGNLLKGLKFKIIDLKLSN